jgi:hypothetical protein
MTMWVALFVNLECHRLTNCRNWRVHRLCGRVGWRARSSGTRGLRAHASPRRLEHEVAALRLIPIGALRHIGAILVVVVSSPHDTYPPAATSMLACHDGRDGGTPGSASPVGNEGRRRCAGPVDINGHGKPPSNT